MAILEGRFSDGDIIDVDAKDGQIMIAAAEPEHHRPWCRDRPGLTALRPARRRRRGRPCRKH